MSLRKINAVLKKQLKDTLKNLVVLIQFVMFPVLTIIMQNAIKIEGMGPNYFVLLFATMYIGMAPLTSTANIISEEKENNTLRVLMMSNVKAGEYLIGVGSYVLIICMLGSLVMGLAGNYSGQSLVKFLLIMCAGIITSILIGAVIGTKSKNQMAANALSIPLMMLFAFLPMISMFNKTVAKISRFTYSQQINNMLTNIESSIEAENLFVIAGNVAVVLILFVIAYRKCGLAS